MSTPSDPDDWEEPLSHPDWNARVDFLALQAVARCAQLRLPNAVVSLRSPEEGLMYLEVAHADESLAEVYAVEHEGGRRYAVYLRVDTAGESEHYCITPDEVADCLIPASQGR